MLLQELAELIHLGFFTKGSALKFVTRVHNGRVLQHWHWDSLHPPRLGAGELCHREAGLLRWAGTGSWNHWGECSRGVNITPTLQHRNGLPACFSGCHFKCIFHLSSCKWIGSWLPWRLSLSLCDTAASEMFKQTVPGLESEQGP